MKIKNINIVQFLTFSITPENQAMLPTDRLAEVLNLDPSHIIPIADMPPAVMGVSNWRGQVLWLVDLAYLLGLGALFVEDLYHLKHTVLVVRSKSKVLGLAVNKVGHLIGCDESQIQPPPTIALPQMQVLSLCLKGQIMNSDGRKLLVLDADVIVELGAKG